MVRRPGDCLCYEVTVINSVILEGFLVILVCVGSLHDACECYMLVNVYFYKDFSAYLIVLVYAGKVPRKMLHSREEEIWQFYRRLDAKQAC